MQDWKLPVNNHKGNQPTPARKLLTELAMLMNKSNASDLHLQEGLPPYLRIVGVLYPQEGMAPLDHQTMNALIEDILDEDAKERLETHGAVDSSLQLPMMRLRLNAFKHEGGLALSFRRIPASPPGFTELNLPPVIKRFANIPRGLVIICGPTGSGKSTTLAALIHIINSSRRVHIITIEDPVEFIHRSIVSLVVQREIGEHTHSFADALRDALREDPDVLLVGEMRDTETIELALRAAETGHLVFSTLHTSGAAGSLARIIDAFDPAVRSTVRVQLSLVLQGVVSQILVPTKDGHGRVPVCEVLMVNDAIRHLIRENKLEQIPNMIQAGGLDGMLSFSAHIAELAKSGKIDISGGLEVVSEGWRISDVLFER